MNDSTSISVHDNFVYAYSIDCEHRRIILHTEFRDQEPNELTDIIFSNVTAHLLENALPSNILFDVIEEHVDALVHEFSGLFATSWRMGWPPVEYRGDLDVLKAKLKAASMRVYSIHSSYGLSGWILAEKCEFIARNEAASVDRLGGKN